MLQCKVSKEKGIHGEAKPAPWLCHNQSTTVDGIESATARRKRLRTDDPVSDWHGHGSSMSSMASPAGTFGEKKVDF